jgi:hypothetical protein
MARTARASWAAGMENLLRTAQYDAKKNRRKWLIREASSRFNDSYHLQEHGSRERDWIGA